MKRNVDGIHNRGPSERETEPFVPTTAAVNRAMKLRAMANTFRSVAEEIQDIAPDRSKKLKNRAQLMRIKVALILLGDDVGEDDDE